MSTAEIIAELRRLSSSELALVQATVKELTDPVGQNATPLTAHPALGIWRDRIDLSNNSVEASKQLRERMMQPAEPANDPQGHELRDF